jgi:hypothetical protein
MTGWLAANPGQSALATPAAHCLMFVANFPSKLTSFFKSSKACFTPTVSTFFPRRIPLDSCAPSTASRVSESLFVRPWGQQIVSTGTVAQSEPDPVTPAAEGSAAQPSSTTPTGTGKAVGTPPPRKDDRGVTRQFEGHLYTGDAEAILSKLSKKSVFTPSAGEYPEDVAASFRQRHSFKERVTLENMVDIARTLVPSLRVDAPSTQPPAPTSAPGPVSTSAIAPPAAASKGSSVAAAPQRASAAGTGPTQKPPGASTRRFRSDAEALSSVLQGMEEVLGVSYVGGSVRSMKKKSRAHDVTLPGTVLLVGTVSSCLRFR